MKKVAFILPGFFCSTTENGYQAIGKSFAAKDFKVVYVEIIWKYKRARDYLNQFQAVYQKEKGDVNVFLGFSYGALIAYLSTPSLKPNALYLCSLASYFKEDLKFIPQEEKVEIGAERWADIEKCSFDDTAKQIACPVILFVGENEKTFTKRRANLAKEKIKNIRVIQIPNVGHDISNDRYIKIVQGEISQLT